MTEKKLGIGEEYLLTDESSYIDRICKVSERILQRSKDRPLPREQHPKQHGCVRAEFIVEDNLFENPPLPESLQEKGRSKELLKVGLFKESKTFPAWIRFSNATQKNDSKGGVHGMAIKLMEVEGNKELEEEKKTQDLVMIDYPVFFIRNIPDYVEFSEEREKLPFPLKFFLSKQRWRHELKILLSLLFRKKIGSPLEAQYWSTTPYKLGSIAIKFFVRPSTDTALDKLRSKGKDYLREAMVEHLTVKNKEARFDFYVQLQTDPAKMPVEDPTIEWKDAPEYKVATIKIPPQKFDSREQMEFGENLSFTPWHCLSEHRPLGGMNRARKEVYLRTSILRHSENEVSRQEPTPESF
ncbi:MAG: catalase family protein [Aphanothece sp. CMT-3BRIN-NPC111]|jgi:hypothetical protein|nr:catalase family protein [Aphanothece sp. CMT-3BRIN-NPC111]